MITVRIQVQAEDIIITQHYVALVHGTIQYNIDLGVLLRHSMIHHTVFQAR